MQTSDADKEPICGVTQVDISGREWICRRPVHAKIYRRRNGQIAFDNNPQADKHYFQVRYPYGRDDARE